MTKLNETTPPSNVPHFATVLMTPEWAAKLLAHDGPKRSISALYVGKLARMITSGSWHATHQTIAVNKDGRLIDGHHRCSAIVKAGQPTWVVLATYPDDGPIGAFDQGAKRTAGHVLEMTGKVRQGAGGKYESLARALHIGLTQKHTAKLAVHEIDRVVERYRKEFDWIVSSHRKHLLAPHLAAFAYVYPLFPQQVDEMAVSLSRVANMTYRSPLWHLSQELAKADGRLGYPEYPDAFLRVLRVIDAHVTGRQMKILKGQIDDTESTPKIIVEWSRRREVAGLPVDTF